MLGVWWRLRPLQGGQCTEYDKIVLMLEPDLVDTMGRDGVPMISVHGIPIPANDPAYISKVQKLADIGVVLTIRCGSCLSEAARATTKKVIARDS